MLLFKRPVKPEKFDQAVNQQKKKVEECFPPDTDSTGSPAKPDFDDLWSKYKGEFAAIQHGKCGYCEMSVIGAGFGDVEHYRPKGEVSALGDDPRTWGQEKEHLSNVSGRKFFRLSETGYWWLAYDWDNYLFSCPICNQSWKRAVFPATGTDDSDRPIPPEEKAAEVGLLLNPYDGPDPVDHLTYGTLGEIMPFHDSPYGYETIRTCGLDRPSLRKRRLRILPKVFQLVREVLEAQTDEEIDQALRGIYELGQEDMDFAGMVRIIFEQQCQIAWEDIVNQYGD